MQFKIKFGAVFSLIDKNTDTTDTWSVYLIGRSGGGGGGAGTRSPLGPNLLIFMQFLRKIDQNNRLAPPPLGLAPPPPVNLDPPLLSRLFVDPELIQNFY